MKNNPASDENVIKGSWVKRAIESVNEALALLAALLALALLESGMASAFVDIW